MKVSFKFFLLKLCVLTKNIRLKKFKRTRFEQKLNESCSSSLNKHTIFIVLMFILCFDLYLCLPFPNKMLRKDITEKI